MEHHPEVMITYQFSCNNKNKMKRRLINVTIYISNTPYNKNKLIHIIILPFIVRFSNITITQIV